MNVETILRSFERMSVLLLIFMLVLTVLTSIIELGWLLIVDLMSPPLLLLEVDEILDIFGMFLLVLIGIELIDTLHAYLNEKEVHLEVVLSVGLIAVARKVILIDIKKTEPTTLLGIAAIILALSFAYLLVKKGRCGWLLFSQNSKGKSIE